MPGREALVTEKESAGSGTLPTRSSSYYFEPIVFQVQDSLFKVPREHFTKHSSVFRDMFTIPQCENSACDGSSDANPVKLEGIAKADFESLLKVIFPLHIHSLCRMTRDEWLGVLRLSNMWYFRDIFALAVSRLSGMKINPGLKVALAKEFNISIWLECAVIELVFRDAPPSLQETQYIGMETAVTIFHLREERWKVKKTQSNKQSLSSVYVKSKLTAEMQLMDEGYAAFMTEESGASGSEETSPALLLPGTAAGSPTPEHGEPGSSSPCVSCPFACTAVLDLI